MGNVGHAELRGAERGRIRYALLYMRGSDPATRL